MNLLKVSRNTSYQGNITFTSSGFTRCLSTNFNKSENSNFDANDAKTFVNKMKQDRK